MNKIIDPFTNKEIEFVDPFAEQAEPENKGGMGKAFGAGVDKLQELGYRAVKGFTDVGNEGDGFLEQDGALSRFAQRGIDENIEEQKAYEPTVPSYKDVNSIGSAASYAGELVANSLPYMAGAITPVGAGAMAGGLSQEAYETQPEDEKNALRATASGVGQMALERLGIKGSMGEIGKDILKDGVVATAKRYKKGEFIRAAKDPKTALAFSKRVLKGALWEGATESAQESLAMWGAGKDFEEFEILSNKKYSKDILGADGQALMESFVGGATVGGIMRTGSEGVQKLVSWQQKSAPIAKNGIDELVKQGVTQEEAIEQVSKQIIASGMKQGLSEAEAAAAAARTMKTEYDIDHEIFTPVANDVASRRKALYEKLDRDRIEGGFGRVQESIKGEGAPSAEALVQQQMRENDPAFFENLNNQVKPEEGGNIAEKSPEVTNITETEEKLPKGKGNIANLEVVEAPVGELSLSNDVPQFKSGANDKGVVEPLGGKFDRTGVSPIQVWVRKDGRKEVISGRHRTELAQRSGEQTIPAQYHYEENGFDKYQAAALDAILNVREGQGKVKDYVDFIKHTGLTEAEANEQGILARATGKRAYTIASQGSDPLIAAHRNNGITDEAAVRIAKAAPNDEALQAVGIKAIDDGKTITVAENMVKAVKSFSSEQQQGSGDLFGFDDSAMIEAENLAKAASKKQAEIQRSLSAIQGAAKRPELAAKEGVNVKDPKAVNQRIEQLKEDKRQWDNWHTNPELVAQLKDKPDINQEQTPQATASQEAVVVSEAIENDATVTDKGTMPQAPDMFGGTTNDKPTVPGTDNSQASTKQSDSEKAEVDLPKGENIVNADNGEIYAPMIKIPSRFADSAMVTVVLNPGTLGERKKRISVGELRKHASKGAKPVKASGSRSIDDNPISDDVLNNFETALDAVNWLEANAKEPAFKEIAKKIKGAIDPSVKFVMLGDGQQTLGVLKGRYSYKERNNEIIKNQLEIYDQGKVESTLIHELIHVATSRVINNPKTTKQKEAVSQLNTIKREIDALRMLDHKQWSTLTKEEQTQFRTVGLSRDEFVTYTLTNKHFQNGLKKLSYKSEQESLFVKLGGVIKSLLGLNNTPNSVFARAIDATSAIIEVAELTDTLKGSFLDSETKPTITIAGDIAPEPTKNKPTAYGEGVERVQHTVRKSGKILTGIVDNSLSRDDAKAIDPYAFRKGKDGWFIRDNRITEYNEKNSPVKAADSIVEESAEIKEVVKVEPEPVIEEKQTQGTNKTKVDSKISENRKLLDFMVQELKTAHISNNNDLKAIGKRYYDLEKAVDVTPQQLKVLQEAFETVNVIKRRKTTQSLLGSLSNKDAAVLKVFNSHVSAYSNQPNLDVRTKKSVEFQAYSTPAPMSFLSNIAAGIDVNTTVFEPTAGNGLLLLTSSPENTYANELDPVRADSLAYTGFNVTTENATNSPFDGLLNGPVDAVLANPPFGRLRDDNGKPTEFTFTDKQGKQRVFKEIDHVIAYQALEAMKDDGKAALILGAPKDAGDYKGNNKIFLNWLYQNYNVQHHIEADGKLYKGQGAAWPLQMITIYGRSLEGTGKFAPIKGQIERLTSWEGIYENYKQHGLLDTKGKQFKPGRKSTGNVSDSQGAKVVTLPGRANNKGRSDSTVSENAVSRKTRPQAVLPDNGPTRISADASVGFNSQQDISKPGLVKTSNKSEPKIPSDKTSKPTNGMGLSGQRTSEPVVNQKGHNSAPKQISTKVNKINDFQAEYQTASDGFNDKVLTPVNIASYTQSALIDIQKRHGSIDDFVMDRLDYDNKKDLHKAFMGLQADSIALAVDAIEKGRGIVIGDQTGVGKGRQAAGIIRYALKNGKTPIFVSQKPNLFTDMFDDLGDIGVTEFSPLIVNQDKGYISKGGSKLFNHSATNRKKLMNEVSSKRKLPKGYDALFLTYSQISSDSKGIKTSMVDGLLDNAILVMDESHTAAGGASKLGLAFQGFVSKAAGVTYLSATYAKRPDNMLLYMRTDLGLATDNYENLVSAVQSGGLGMQTYIASKLAEAGQMVRRERSFEGISIKDEVIKDSSGETAKLFDQTTEALRAIQDTSAYWRSYVERDLADDIQRESGLDTSVSGNQSDTAINVTLFSSVVHNYIRQLTLGLKAKESAQLAIKAIKEGKRPIIALESTLGSALKAYMAKYGKVTGDYADSLNFSTMLEAVLDNTLTYSTKEPGEKKGVKTVVSINAVSDPMVQDAYHRAMEAIEKIDASKIPASPIDAIRYEITKAGHSVAEITGRDLIVDYNDNAKIINRPTAEDNRRDIVDQFNNSKIDVIILNQAGSTGLSLHASEKLAKKHQKPRYMVIAEPSLDVNVYMQMLGRANRTGQVVPPSYDNAWLDLPSEKRPAAVISRKMKGLNANTSGNVESATSVESIDILNEYGDEVVRNYAIENKRMLASYNPKLIDLPEEDSANYFLGKVAVLPVKIQDKVLSEIEAAYVDHIAFLDATGQNQLNTTSLDLDARPISQKVIAESRSSAGVFAEPVYLTKVEAKAQGKAPSWAEVSEALAETNQADFDVAVQRMQDDSYGKSLDERLSSLQELESKARSEGKKTDSYLAAIVKIKERQQDFEADKRQISNDLSEGGIYSHGAFINVMPNETFEKAVHGVVVGLDYKHETGNPTAKSKWKLKVMVADRMRTIPITLSRAQDGVIQGRRWDSQSNMEKMFDQMSKLPQTETRYIMTGNLVEATTSTAKQGRIVPFSTHDGRVIQGLLLPNSFNENEDVKEKAQATTEESVKWLLNVDDDIFASMGLSTSDKAVTVRRKRWEEGYSVEMPKSAAKGKKYWGNEAIEAIIGEQAVKGGGVFSVDLTEEQVMPFAKAMKAINPLGVRGQAQIKSFNKMFNKDSSDFDDSNIMFKAKKSDLVSNDNTGKSGYNDKVSEEKALAELEQFVQEFPGVRDVKFKIGRTETDVFGREVSEEGYSIYGAYDPNKDTIYLVAGAFDNVRDLRKTIHHELLVHKGLGLYSEKAQKDILSGILYAAENGEPTLKRQWKQIKDDYADAPPLIQAEELLALISEQANSIWNSPKLNQLIVAFRRLLRKLGIIKHDTGKAELVSEIQKIGKQLALGRKPSRRPRDPKVSDTPKSPSSNLRFRRGKNGHNIPDETRKDAFIRRMQDKLRRLKVVQRELDVTEANDAYMAEEAFHGKVSEDLRQMSKDYTDSIAKTMADNNLSQDEVDLYLIAKHAQERNAYIDTINPELNGAGSGMTNEDAQAILDKAVLEEKRLPLEKIAGQVYGMLAHAREQMVRFGLEPQDAIDSWQQQYQYYVPLKGYANDDANTNSKGKKLGKGKGFNIKGRETIKAMGRRSLAESPLLHAISDTTQAIIRARKNEVGNTFLKLVNDNPDPELWQIFTEERPDTKRGYVTIDGVKTVTQVPMSSFEMNASDDYYKTKVDGKERFVKIHDQFLLRAMGNLGVDEANMITVSLGKFTRLLSALVTTWAPEFMLTNAARDIQAAIANVLAETQVEDGKALKTKGLAMKMIKSYPKALSVLKKGFRNDSFSDPEWGPYLKEFLESGAKTGWVNQKDIEGLAKELSATIGRSSNSALGKTKRIGKSIADFVQDYNDVVENAARFSAYYHARKQGVSVKMASSLAKNLTINFNRKGEIGNTLNAFYMFANASVQGTANMLRAVATPKDRSKSMWNPEYYNLSQKLAIGAVGATILAANLMRMIGGDDDDGIPLYDKVPDHVKATNFVLLTGGKDKNGKINYIAIPMSYGYNIFASMGHAIDGVSQGKSVAGQAGNLLLSALSAFSPIGAQESENVEKGLLKTVVPTVLKPVAELAVNENFFGGSIYPEQFGYSANKADSHLGNARTWEWTKGLTTWLNDVTGGTQFRSGKIDIAPQSIDHMIKFMGGGVLQFAARWQNLAAKAIDGKEIERGDIPFSRRFMKQVSPKAAIASFYEDKDALNSYVADFKSLHGADKTEYRNKYKAHLELANFSNGIEKALRSLNARKRTIEASKLSEKEKEVRIQRIEDRKVDLSLRFSKKKVDLGIRYL